MIAQLFPKDDETSPEPTLDTPVLMGTFAHASFVPLQAVH